MMGKNFWERLIMPNGLFRVQTTNLEVTIISESCRHTKPIGATEETSCAGTKSDTGGKVEKERKKAGGGVTKEM